MGLGLESLGYGVTSWSYSVESRKGIDSTDSICLFKLLIGHWLVFMPVCRACV